ncbi:GNAT family N-acetyltransferase [Mucisphaera sp.]|uniref:GNAT family N-acetyltransferase n=1 Tax=Mucisphaera sp. TaxID=2913024 RepID=UPI003D120D35
MTLRSIVKPFEALTPRELHDAYRLRCEVFVVEQRITAEPEVDDYDPAAVFHLIYEGDHCMATARVLPGTSERPAKVCRVCVAGAQRGRGLGRRLMSEIDRRLAGQPATLHAQVQLEGWYAGLGWRREGAVFMEAGIEHVLMCKP